MVILFHQGNTQLVKFTQNQTQFAQTRSFNHNGGLMVKCATVCQGSDGEQYCDSITIEGDKCILGSKLDERDTYSFANKSQIFESQYTRESEPNTMGFMITGGDTSNFKGSEIIDATTGHRITSCNIPDLPIHIKKPNLFISQRIFPTSCFGTYCYVYKNGIWNKIDGISKATNGNEAGVIIPFVGYFLTGGEDGSGVMDQSAILNPDTLKISKAGPQLPIPISRHRSILLNDTAVLIYGNGKCFIYSGWTGYDDFESAGKFTELLINGLRHINYAGVALYQKQYVIFAGGWDTLLQRLVGSTKYFDLNNVNTLMNGPNINALRNVQLVGLEGEVYMMYSDRILKFSFDNWIPMTSTAEITIGPNTNDELNGFLIPYRTMKII